MKKYLSTLLFFLPLAIFAQQSEVIKIDSLPQKGILLDKGWKWHTGDNPDFVKTDFDDASWESIDPTKNILDIPQLWASDIGWFRIKFNVDRSLQYKPLVLLVRQTGAAEYFLNGEANGGFGEFNKNPENIIAEEPLIGSYLALPIKETGEQTLAVRFALQKNIPYYGKTTFMGLRNDALNLKIIDANAVSSLLQNNVLPYYIFARFGVFLLLSIFHLALFFYATSQKANLYFFLFNFFIALAALGEGLAKFQLHVAHNKEFVSYFYLFFGVIGLLFCLVALYKTFHKSLPITFWLITVLAIVPLILTAFDYHFAYLINMQLIALLVNLEAIRQAFIALKDSRRGSKIVFAGCLSFILLLILFFIMISGVLPSGPNDIYKDLAFNLSAISIPISFAIFLAGESSYFNRTLQLKLVELEKLSTEKQQILSKQNETLERQVAERTSDLRASQKQLIQSEKMASLGELTAGIAHEIQNPLNFVNNFSEVSKELAEELKEEANKENFDKGLIAEIATDIAENQKKIHHHGQRASSIVKGMLEHSRTSSGKKELTDINALADEYLRLSYHGLRAKDKDFNAELVTNFDPNLPKIDVIPQDIGRVLLNLINNAFQAVDEQSKKGIEGYKPKVSVKTELTANSQKQIAIKISDNGPGIPDAIKNKIFQPFFTTKDTGKGTGLGLSLAYDIVKAHGGELKVESEEGKGSKFQILLPIN